MQRIEPSQGLFKLVKVMFRDAWDMRLAQAAHTATELTTGIKRIEAQVEQLLDRIVDASNDSVISAYEKRIGKLEREKVLMEEKSVTAGKPRMTLEESFEHALQFLSNPWKIWTNADLVLKNRCSDWHFRNSLPYCRI